MPLHQSPYLRSPLPETPAERERARLLAEGVREYPVTLASLQAAGLSASVAHRTIIGLPPYRGTGRAHL